MTNEKSQVAVKLTAEDIKKYFQGNKNTRYGNMVDFLEDFREKHFSIDTFKYRIISTESREYKIRIMDNIGNEHEGYALDTFIDNIDDILRSNDPLCRFWDYVDSEFIDEMEFYQECALEELQEHIKNKDIFAFLGPISVPPYGQYLPITHLLENPNEDVIQWVIENNPIFNIEYFWERNEEYDFDEQLDDESICGFINRKQKNPELREMLLKHYKGQ